MIQYVQNGWLKEKRRVHWPIAKYWSERGNISLHNGLLLQRGRRIKITSKVKNSCVLSCRRSPRAENRTPLLNPRLSLNPLRFYPTSKVFPNNFLQQQGVSAIFKSETTVRSHSVRPKDAVDSTKQDGVVYRIPCECGKVYIGETHGIYNLREKTKANKLEILDFWTTMFGIFPILFLLM